jgi:type IV secretory pathway TrbF-like protein
VATKSTRATQGNTFLRARDAFLTVFSDPVRGRRNWTLTAYGLLVSNVILAVSYVQLASTAQWTPYVVKVDRFGQVAYAGPAEKTETSDPQLVVYQLALFIRNVRTVTSDATAQVEFIRRAYAFLGQRAAGFVNAHFSDPSNDPRTLGRSSRRTVTINSVMPIPNSKTWKVQWTEDVLPITGGAATSTSWEAYATVEFRQREPGQPKTDAEWQKLFENPLNLFITELTWAPLAKGDVTQ